MTTRSFLRVAAAGFVLAGVARGQFVPGHVFIANNLPKGCDMADIAPERIWEVDPQTGEASVFAELWNEECGGIAGLTFTPDGQRLRVAMFRRNCCSGVRFRG